jgi:hypothetical protein
MSNWREMRKPDMMHQRVRTTIFACVACVALNACASIPNPAQQRMRTTARAETFSPANYALKWVLRSAQYSEDAKPRLGSDQTVGMGGMLGHTVNEVVPIPGTDMVRVGALQEGSLFQSNFRSPQQETTGQSGSILTNATVIFRVTRPLR